MKPRLLDACCGAGGATRGYQQAGFEVTGVDIKPQPNYPGDHFVQADAVRYVVDNGWKFDFVHASWPCERYAKVTRWRGQAQSHPDLLGVGREALTLTGVPWVIENVPEAPLRPDFLLCGTGFGLRVKRHRAFETSGWHGVQLTAPCRHDDMVPFDHKQERAFADAMGCTWMSKREARQAIPPAYTRWIGEHFLTMTCGANELPAGA